MVEVISIWERIFCCGVCCLEVGIIFGGLVFYYKDWLEKFKVVYGEKDIYIFLVILVF